ncbi:hypothetical protein GH741_11750 [Aquibacillus halophilus]|uniref:Uncharacterized protein n=1 Tax=Aquibacillus halophilus TaxID=930132 RepID=A0A6A8DQ40_9BACI|nr:hypothetical protein [Aquibacillus halophilus]MRH43352.1 hypothetical protein [Aquibacillus halophilus]
MGDIWASNGLKSDQSISEIGVSFVSYTEDDQTILLPSHNEEEITPTLYKHTWATWNEPHFKERLKQSYFIMKDTFAE